MSRIIQQATPVNEIGYFPTGNYTRTLAFPQSLSAGSTIILVAATWSANDADSGEVLSATFLGANFVSASKTHRAASQDMTLQVFFLPSAVSAGAGSVIATIEGVSGQGHPQHTHLFAFEVPAIDTQASWWHIAKAGEDGITNISVSAGGSVSINASFVVAVATTWPSPLTIESSWEEVASRSSQAGGLSVSVGVRELSSSAVPAAQWTHPQSTYGACALMVGFGVVAQSSATDSYATFYVEPAAAGVQNVVGGVFNDNGSVTCGSKITDFVGLAFDPDLTDGKAKIRVPLTAAQAAPLADGQIVRGAMWAENKSGGVRGIISGQVTKSASGGGSTPGPSQPILIPISTNGIATNTAAYRSLWGPGLAILDGLWDAPMNTASRRVSMRFRASTSAVPSSCRLYWVDGSGYALGNGGTIVAAIYPDNGAGEPDLSAAHFGMFTRTPASLGMSGGVYAAATNRFSLDGFTGARALQEGSIYHLVGRNTAASPTADWCSWDCQTVIGVNGRNLPWAQSLDYAVLFYDGTSWSDWSVQSSARGGSRIVPIMQLNYSGGASQGSSLMETGNLDAPATVLIRKTNSSILEHFLPIQRRVWRGMSFRCAKVSGSGGLRIVISGAISDIHAFTVDDPGNNYAASTSVWNTTGILPWQHWEMPNPITFEAGQDYVIQCVPQGSSVWAFAPQRNGKANGFSSPAAFTESWAEHYDGSWKRTYAWNYSIDNSDADYNWPFVLHLVP